MTDDKKPSPEAMALLCRMYVQRADARQQAMGLQYTEAETHDLACLLDAFAAQARTAAFEEAAQILDDLVVPSSGWIPWGEVSNAIDAIRALAAAEAPRSD